MLSFQVTVSERCVVSVTLFGQIIAPVTVSGLWDVSVKALSCLALRHSYSFWTLGCLFYIFLTLGCHMHSFPILSCLRHSSGLWYASKTTESRMVYVPVSGFWVVWVSFSELWVVSVTISEFWVFWVLVSKHWVISATEPHFLAAWYLVFRIKFSRPHVLLLL